MKTYLSIILILSAEFLHAQNQANNWYFGYYNGITFDTNPPTALTNGEMTAGEGCMSISDDNGNLIFYSNGVEVWDSTHSTMQNGTGLLGDNSSSQSAIALKAPGSNTLYYLITAPLNTSTTPLVYSVIDMSMNNGLGAVTTKNIALLDSSTEKVTAVYHPNGIDVWIIAHGNLNNNFYSYSVTSTGIDTVPVVSSTGNIITNENLKIGYLKASPCGNQLAMANWGGFGPGALSSLELFDFDNATGVVSGAATIGQWTTLNSGVYGVEFSPDNSKLYATILTPSRVLQYDLLAGSTSAIIASVDTLASYPTLYYGALQTGPDGRIYIVKYTENSLAAILNPNEDGIACSFVDNFVSLLMSNSSIGLPAFVSSVFCNIPSSSNPVIDAQGISVFPNPFREKIEISFPKQNVKQANIIINNILGTTVFESSEQNPDYGFTKEIDLSFLSKGIYLLEINIDGERTVQKIVKK